MATIKTTLESFKQMAKEALQNLSILKTTAQTESAQKCLMLGYVGMEGKEHEIELAKGVLDYTLGKIQARELDILFGRV